MISDARSERLVKDVGLRLSQCHNGDNCGRVDEQSQVAAEIVVKVLVSLQARARNGRDTLLKRLQPLRERLLALDARELVLQRMEHGIGLCAVTDRGQFRGEIDDAAVSNLEHGGFGLHVY